MSQGVWVWRGLSGQWRKRGGYVCASGVWRWVELPKYNREMHFTASVHFSCSQKTEETWIIEIIDGPGRKKVAMIYLN